MSHPAIPVHFMEISFHELYYDLKQCSVANNVIPWFYEGVAVCTPKCTEPVEPRRLLKLRPLDSSLESTEHVQTNAKKFVIMQILHMMPLMFSGYDSAELVVHELLVVSWSCTEKIATTNPFDQRYFGRRRSEEVVQIVLDGWTSYCNINVCSRGHVALVFEESMYDRILKNSDELRRKTQEQVEYGKTITLGRSIVEISRNLDAFHNARAFLRRVLELADVAILEVERASNVPVLQNLKLVVTDTLDGVTPPPPPSECDD